MKNNIALLTTALFLFLFSYQELYSQTCPTGAVVGRDASTVYITDPNTGVDLGQVTLPNHASSILVTSSGHAYALIHQALHKINTVTMAPDGVLPLTGNSFSAMDCSPDETKLAITHQNTSNEWVISIIDLTTFTVSGSPINIPDNQVLAYPVYSTDGSKIYAAERDAARVAVIDANTLSYINSIPITGINSPHGLLPSPDGNYLYVFGTQIYRLNLNDNTVLNSNVSTPSVQQYAISPDGAYLFFQKSNAILGRISTANFQGVPQEVDLIGGGAFGNFHSMGLTFDGTQTHVFVNYHDQHSAFFLAVVDFSLNILSDNPISHSLLNQYTTKRSVKNCVGAVPTLSQWGLIIFALMLLSMCMIAVMEPKRVLAISGTDQLTVPAPLSWKERIPFQAALYQKVLLASAIGMVLIFLVAVAAFGYEMTTADVPGSIVATPVLAYLLHLLFMNQDKATKENIL